MPDIICEDCGATRLRAQYKNTKYCVSDRLLRDLLHLAEKQRRCTHCTKQFAPVSRGDTLCGDCNYGSSSEGFCFFCKNEHAELYRPSIPVCCKCVRSPRLRPSIIAGLKKGQRERRAANAHPATAQES